MSASLIISNQNNYHKSHKTTINKLMKNGELWQKSYATQLVCGFLALRRITRQQAARFHLHQVLWEGWGWCSRSLWWSLFSWWWWWWLWWWWSIGRHGVSCFSCWALAWWASTTLPLCRRRKRMKTSKSHSENKIVEEEDENHLA